MITDAQKLKRFTDEAILAANEAAAEIMADVNKKKKNVLSESERKINDEAKTYINEELKTIRRANTREISMKTMELRSELLKRREAILDGVMDEVVKKLHKFADTEELYGDYLENLCVKVIESFGSSCTVYLSPSDAEKYIERINKRINGLNALNSLSVLSDDSIKIGGAKFHSSESSIFINETLDENLERQREQFTSMMVSAMREVSAVKNKRAGKARS